MPTIYSGWREQYDRMFRSHERLEGVGTGAVAADSDEARDILIHFYQDAFHLRDWIKNDQALPQSVSLTWPLTPALAICSDVANGAKHLSLNRAWTGDTGTGPASQSVKVRPGPAGGSPDPAIHSWRVESAGQSHDALDLAGRVVQDWKAWLSTNGLL